MHRQGICSPAPAGPAACAWLRSHHACGMLTLGPTSSARGTCRVQLQHSARVQFVEQASAGAAITVIISSQLRHICLQRTSPVCVQLHDQRAVLQSILLRPADGLARHHVDGSAQCCTVQVLDKNMTTWPTEHLLPSQDAAAWHKRLVLNCASCVVRSLNFLQLRCIATRR